jgi:hypothetical protein
VSAVEELYGNVNAMDAWKKVSFRNVPQCTAMHRNAMN